MRINVTFEEQNNNLNLEFNQDNLEHEVTFDNTVYVNLDKVVDVIVKDGSEQHSVVNSEHEAIIDLTEYAKDTDVNAEALARENADTAERNARIDKDTILSNAISTETSAREQTDVNLAQEINNRIQAVNNEQTARINSDNVIRSNLNEEINNRVAGDNFTLGKLNQSVEVNRNQGDDFTYNGNEVKFNRKYKNLSTTVETVKTETIKLANTEHAGLMSKEDKNRLSEVTKVQDNHINQNGTILIDNTTTIVYDDTEIRQAIAKMEVGWVINNKSEITGTEDSKGNFTNVTAIVGLDLSLIKIGDNIYIKNADDADYWVSGKVNNVLSLNVLDTKTDLSNYYNKSEINGLLSAKQDASTLDADVHSKGYLKLADLPVWDGGNQ